MLFADDTTAAAANDDDNDADVPPIGSKLLARIGLSIMMSLSEDGDADADDEVDGLSSL